MKINEETVVEYINNDNQIVTTVVNTDSQIDARKEVATRCDVQKILHTRPATPMDEF